MKKSMTNKIDYSFETIFDLIKLNECTLTEFEFWVACKENKLYNFIQQILHILIEKISDEKISWLNLVYDDIFSKEIFVNAIKQSNYLFLDTVNKRVIRKKLNLNTDNIKEFNPNKENIIPVLDINALEYKPVSDDTELLANKMVDSLFD
jgi:hypothetical protein